MAPSEYLAHSHVIGRSDPLRSHLALVAERASEFASAFGAEREAHLAGLLHDLGKYGDLFPPWGEVAEQLAARDQSLCVVNLKRHALLLHKELKQRKAEGLFHLSTNMCPVHREAVLEEVRRAARLRSPSAVPPDFYSVR